MEKRHEMDLDRALERLALQGAVSIPWDELYFWFNADRLGKTAYREIIRRWEDLCLETWKYSKAPGLSVLRTHNSLLTLLREPFKEEDEEIVPLASWT